MNIEVYNSAIQDTWIYLSLNMIPILTFGIILIVIALVAFFKKFMKRSIIALIFILGIMASTFSVVELSVFGYDISHVNFESYCGEFDYMQVSGNRKDIINFSKASELYIRSVADLSIDTGTHDGYILYGKTSRWVIAYSDVPFE